MANRRSEGMGEKVAKLICWIFGHKTIPIKHGSKCMRCGVAFLSPLWITTRALEVLKKNLRFECELAEGNKAWRN